MYSRFQRFFSNSTRPSTATILQTFSATPALHFASEQAFFASPLYPKLRSLFQSPYQLSSSTLPPLTTLSMTDTLKFLGLETLFHASLDPARYLIGIHGTSQSSLAAVVPDLAGIKNMATSHNPYQARDNNVLFFYGSNVHMTLHYAAINSIVTEDINGASDPLHYPVRIGVLGFARQPVITAIQQSTIQIATTYAAVKESHHTQPEEKAIGTEIQLPKHWHHEILNVPVFSIQGKCRLFPLHQGTHYFKGEESVWQPGKGLIPLEVEETKACKR